ncbi:MAG: hypothetical protein ACTSUQ_07870 [Candidatus Freyarchaeota archaeon]
MRGIISPDDSKSELIGIVGSENVCDDEETLKSFSSDYSFVEGKTPILVVKPKNVEQIQRIVRLANEKKISLIIDDLADNAWGGIYEYGLIGHQEELVLFNPRDKKQAETIEQFVDACAEASAEESLGIGFSLFAGKHIHELFGPRSCNYHIWQKRVKKIFDPDDLSDSTYYISPEE